MPIYTFVVPVNFVFDVKADSEAVARQKASIILDRANRSDKWCSPDVPADFPRITVSSDARVELADVFDGWKSS